MINISLNTITRTRAASNFGGEVAVDSRIAPVSS